MASVIKLTAGMYPEVHSELLQSLNPHLPPERWQLAFSDRGWHDEDHFGYVLIDRGRPVGVLGTLFSRRSIGGREEKFCNLHGWYVKPEHRAGSLLLMRPVLALTDHTLTDFTASPDVIAISKRLGFSTLDSSVWVLPELPWRHQATIDIVRCSDGGGLAHPAVDPVTSRLIRDHEILECGHFIFTDGEDVCCVIFSKMAGVGPAHCEVHHISNPVLFLRYHVAVRARLQKMTGTRFVVVDSRFLPGDVPLAFRLKVIEKLFRTPCVAPGAVDTLYSEIVLLKLPTPYQGVRRATIERCKAWLTRRA